MWSHTRVPNFVIVVWKDSENNEKLMEYLCTVCIQIVQKLLMHFDMKKKNSSVLLYDCFTEKLDFFHPPEELEVSR